MSHSNFHTPYGESEKKALFHFLIFFFRAKRGRRPSGELGWSKKKMNKKKRNHDYDDDYDDQFCTRSNILPFFSQIFTLMFLLFTPKSIYGLYYVPTLCKRHPDEIFCEKKNFFEEKLEFFEKNFFEKKFEIFFYSKKYF